MPASAPPASFDWRQSARRVAAAQVRAYHRYAGWLVGISWLRFILLSVVLLAMAGIATSLPIFNSTVTRWVDEPIELPELPELPVPDPPTTPARPKASGDAADGKPFIVIEKGGDADAGSGDGVTISIDEKGIRIRPRSAAASASASASAASGAASGAADDGEIVVALPEGASREIVQEAIESAREAIREATEAERDARRDAEQATREAHDAAREAITEARKALIEAGLAGGTRRVERTYEVSHADFLPQLALIWILGSWIIKVTYKGRIQAEAKAAQATETAESESLKRQVVEARMAAMQAQVEPHFLFNTLASIDHLIETDPPRASQMQKNLIALLRASMPTMRETHANGVRELGRELAVIRPYLAILKVRMEERLATSIDVPDGLHSAEFPPMMLQSLVENAIKHGLEPKAEGGSLAIKAEVVHGKLALSVADTGLGFGKAATAGTGVGLANIRERLHLLYGAKATLAITENSPGGTRVTITVPYRPVEGASA